VVHLSLFATILVVGWRHFTAPAAEPREVVDWLPQIVTPGSGPKEAGESNAPKGDGKGGGGGGQQTGNKPSVGVRPMMAPIPQLVSITAPELKQPALPITPTLVGPMEAPPPPGSLGTPKSENKAFDAGSGTGGGLGTGEGTGVGPGKGPGAGPGSGGGSGGGKAAGLPNGTGNGAMRTFDWPKVDRKPPAGFDLFHWLYRPRPIVTPEARANKSNGYVLFRADFNADGTITDIDVIAPLDFMTESALESLKHSKFRPATVDGVPVTLRRVVVKVEVPLERVR
jgi:protein TonB